MKWSRILGYADYLLDSATLFLKLRKIIPSLAPARVDFEVSDNPKSNPYPKFMVIESDALRYQGGVSFNLSQHHFLQFYKTGPDALLDYYSLHIPRCFMERHFLGCDEMDHRHDEEPSRILDLPWELRARQLIGEKGLGSSHGNQGFGPVSERKIRLEIRRLNRVLDSINKYGFLFDETNRLAQGYFLEDDTLPTKRRVFLIDSGQHRVSALVHIGWKRIPVVFCEDTARVVRLSEISEWPGVTDSRFSYSQAKGIFNSYFRDAEEVLVCKSSSN